MFINRITSKIHAPMAEKKAQEALDKSVTARRTSKQKAHLFMDVVRESKPVPSDCDN